MKPCKKGSGPDAQGFPRWEISLYTAASNTTATTTTTTSVDCADPRQRTIMATAQHVSSTDTPSSSSYITVSSSEYLVAYHLPFGEDCAPTCGEAACCDCACRLAGRHNAAGEGGSVRPEYVGTEFQKNWPPPAESGTKSESPVEDGSPLPIMRELVVKFAARSAGPESKARRLLQRPAENSRGGDAHRTDQNFPAWREPSPPLHRRRGTFLSNASNAATPTVLDATAANATAADATAANATAADATAADVTTTITTTPVGAEAETDAKKDVQPQPPHSQPPQPPKPQRPEQHPADGEQDHCCLAEYTTFRLLGIVLYYLILWAVTAGITIALLELSLVVTSRGKFPYYMSGHSFFLLSPRVAFAGGNPEPGKSTDFANLTALWNKLAAELKQAGDTSGGGGFRPCDLAADATTEEAALMRPCNLTGFVAKATEMMAALLRDRPVALVQIRRHLGYLPAKGPGLSITCTCTADGKSLALRYHSWNGADIVDSDTGGLVMHSYFPMLTRRHSTPAVIVAVNALVADADWVDKQLTLRCKAADGGVEERPERELLLRVKAKS